MKTICYSWLVIIARFPRAQRSITADLFTHRALVSLVSVCPASDPSDCSPSTLWVVCWASVIGQYGQLSVMDGSTDGRSRWAGSIAVDDLRQGLRSRIKLGRGEPAWRLTTALFNYVLKIPT